MTLNGKELDFTFNPMDADDMERYDKAQTHIAERDALLKEQGELKTYEMIRWQCHSVFEFFNIIFGEGTDKAIFGGQTSLDVCFEVLAEFMAYVSKGSENVVKMTSKYMTDRLERAKPGKYVAKRVK